MDWLCPPYHERLAELITKNYGLITAEMTVRQIIPSLNSGNLQIAIYDLSNDKVYFSYGTKDEKGHVIDAYLRPFIMLDLKKEFALKNE